MGSLDGRVAIVTGAGQGLGRTEALALAGAGARLVLNDLPGGAVEANEPSARGAPGALGLCEGSKASPWRPGPAGTAGCASTTGGVATGGGTAVTGGATPAAAGGMGRGGGPGGGRTSACSG